MPGKGDSIIAFADTHTQSSLSSTPILFIVWRFIRERGGDELEGSSRVQADTQKLYQWILRMEFRNWLSENPVC